MSEYTKKQILDGVECWMNTDSDLWCENCPFNIKNADGTPMFHKDGTAMCKKLVLEEVRKVLQ